ncbi:16S rRNA (adenine(1518)-N(6)/adenine(1519)-N(6))-dimethyltransferase RsmA [Texas Phoenix palm phytoplasma]|uniref:16S rRNA (adenine(1518)-N(6)/adenine(1519)-N(6))- dimethyltransferase RsmA n=1 Tax=Texas Phoenix palm phytoplasma TaxID=176709 RepID=UPI001FEEF8A9|nr:16S rRNA (adenine(1518)-N(6)/adenine(1519)-N(6))-dimethyltransferase RsmA [Texas Phoenix palm phytoplasma]
MKKIINKKHIFKKQYGQHFLKDINLLRTIVNSSNLENENVVEIGPGKGALTQFIVPKAKQFLAYEIDSSLKEFLKFDLYSNFNIIYDDFLNRDLKKDFYKYFKKEKVILIGNLPYYIATPLLFKVLFLSQVKSFTFMLQKEIALRILSKEKLKSFNFLSVIFQSFTKIQKIKFVKRTMFFPVPKVDSIVLKFEKKTFDKQRQYFLENKFLKFVKASFIQKRKTLINNLNIYFNISKIELLKFFDKYQISSNIRAEEIDVITFQFISESFFLFFNL